MKVPITSEGMRGREGEEEGEGAGKGEWEMKRERERGGKTTSDPGSRCVSDLGTTVPGSGGTRTRFLHGFHDISLHPYDEPSLISASLTSFLFLAPCSALAFTILYCSCLFAVSLPWALNSLKSKNFVLFILRIPST